MKNIFKNKCKISLSVPKPNNFFTVFEICFVNTSFLLVLPSIWPFIHYWSYYWPINFSVSHCIFFYLLCSWKFYHHESSIRVIRIILHRQLYVISLSLCECKTYFTWSGIVIKRSVILMSDTSYRIDFWIVLFWKLWMLHSCYN